MPYKWHIQAYIFYDRPQYILYTASTLQTPSGILKDCSSLSIITHQYACSSAILICILSLLQK